MQLICLIKVRDEIVQMMKGMLCATVCPALSLTLGFSLYITSIGASIYIIYTVGFTKHATQEGRPSL